MGVTSIIQWNAQSIAPKKAELIQQIKDFQTSIVAIQESRLHRETGFRIPNFSMLHQEGHTTNGISHGGVALFIREDIPHRQVHLQTTITAIAATVTIKSTFTICNIYSPQSHTLNENLLNHLYQQLPQPCLIVGDFNAHNPLWGGNDTDARGRAVENFITFNQLNLLNGHQPTRIEGLHETSIDLSICSPSLEPELEWSILDTPLDSDHCPIIIQCEDQNQTSQPNLPQGWNIKLAVWEIFSASDTWKDLPDVPTSNRDSLLTDLYSRFEIASSQSIPPRTTHKHYPNPWWNEELKLSKRLREEAYHNYRRNKTRQNCLIWKRLRAQHKYRVNKYRKESFREFISEMKSDAPMQKIYDRMRKIKGRPPRKINFLRDGNTVYTKGEDISNKLAKSFSDVSSTNNYSDIFKRHKIQCEQTPLDLNDNNNEQYNRPFTIRELNHALSSTKDSSPGPDGIHYQMIKNLPKNAKEHLLAIYNKFFNEGHFPEQWKRAIVIAILKPGKDPLYCISYRPIALTSCLCKLFEKMISFRLYDFADIRNLLTNVQCGCRRDRSTLDHLVRLEKEVYTAFAKNEQIISIFFDIEKAYDMTWRHGIIRDLHTYGLRGKLLIYIKEFLKERYFRVKVNNFISREYSQENGVPQGSVLSVLLFAIKINSIIQYLPTDNPNIMISLFVDDLQISCRHPDINNVKLNLQNCLDQINQWSQKNGFKFSSPKTQVIRFQKPYSNPNTPSPDLFFNNNLLSYNNQAKFLGLIWDPKLTWKPQIKKLKGDCVKSLNLLKTVVALKWGADQFCAMKIFRMYTRSKLDYSAPLITAATESNLKTLQPIINEGVRTAFGIFRSTPVESLLTIANEMTLKERSDYLSCRYFLRMKSNLQNPAFNHLFISSPSEQRILRNKKTTATRPTHNGHAHSLPNHTQ